MRRLLPALLLLLVAGCSRPDPDVHTLGERTYRTHGSGGTAVIVLHGGGGNGAQIAEQTGFDALADREGFRAVYPDGSGRTDLRTWNAGSCCAYAHDQGVDDVGFIRALIAELDADRVFVTGFSNGAMLTYRLGCELADEITAIAPVSGSLGVPSCEPSRPLPVYVIHGDADQVVPYAGGKSAKRVAGSHPSVGYAVGVWTGVDRCTGAPVRSVSGVVVSDRYTSCASGTEVRLDTITGGGHAWPGGVPGRRGADQPADFDASAAIWAFFTTHGG